VLIRIRTEV